MACILFSVHGFFLNSHGMVPKGGCSEQQPLNLKSSKTVALEPRKPPSKSYIEQRANDRNATLTGSHVGTKVKSHHAWFFAASLKNVTTVCTSNYHHHQSWVCPLLALGPPSSPRAFWQISSWEICRNTMPPGAASSGRTPAHASLAATSCIRQCNCATQVARECPAERGTNPSQWRTWSKISVPGFYGLHAACKIPSRACAS